MKSANAILFGTSYIAFHITYNPAPAIPHFNPENYLNLVLLIKATVNPNAVLVISTLPICKYNICLSI